VLVEAVSAADAPRSLTSVRPAGVPRFLRLVTFTVASIALHALAAFSYAPATQVKPATHPPSPIHASLVAAIERRPDDPPVATAEALATASEESQSELESGAKAETPPQPDPVTLPLPEKWYAAEELDSRAEPLTAVPLRYPPQYLGTGMTARARILLHVDELGIVRKAAIAEATPERAFGEAALEAWVDVRFSPAMKDGMAVKSRKLVEIDFQPN
jgi:TonB family protein